MNQSGLVMVLIAMIAIEEGRGQCDERGLRREGGCRPADGYYLEDGNNQGEEEKAKRMMTE